MRSRKLDFKNLVSNVVLCFLYAYQQQQQGQASGSSSGPDPYARPTSGAGRIEAGAAA